MLTVFADCKLAPQSVLISNYTEVPQTQTERYVALLSSYFRYRYRDQPSASGMNDVDPAIAEGDDSDLRSSVRKDMGDYYSDFITRFTIDLARSILPNCRALSNAGVGDNHLVAKAARKAIVSREMHEPKEVQSLDEWFDQAGDTVTNAAAYPLLSFIRAIKRLQPPEPAASQISNYQINGVCVSATIELAGLFENVFEGHWDLLSDDMLAAVKESWFDNLNHFSCDVPMPSLLINSLLGVYGRPYHPNVRNGIRMSYKAKTNRMYTDVIPFDQARYYYDWFPVVKSVPTRFGSTPFQIIARCILDRMGWNDWSSESNPFCGAAVACFGETKCAKAYEILPRTTIA